APLVPPLQPTGTDGTKIQFTTTTGAFITAVPTGTSPVIPNLAAAQVNNGLTAAQIGGIIGGVIGGIGLLALLCLWCCLYGLCAAFRRRGSEQSTVIEERRTWYSVIPGLGAGAAAAVAGGRRRPVAVVTEEKSHFGRNAAIIGSLGAFWLYEKFIKKDEPRRRPSGGRTHYG